MTTRYKFTIDASGDPHGKSISARLGNLVVWVSYALAALLLGFAAFDPHHDATPWIVSIAVGGGAIVLGYAIRNFLTGNQKA
jgi:hypothetical protein